MLLSGALVLASVVVTAHPASAGRDDPPGHHDANHCFNSLGVDLNELFDVPTQLRTFDCRTISAGERWIAFLPWITDDAEGNVYPDGYVPEEPAPLDDFLAKLDAINIVIDGGTAQEKVHTHEGASAVHTGLLAEQLDPGFWNGEPYPLAALMPVVPPVSVGEHTYEMILVLRAEHCDGLGPDPELQCLPAGELSIGVRPLTISPPAP
jgi:hypothetical protein